MNINPADSSNTVPAILVLSPAVSFSQGMGFMQLHGGTLQNPSLDTSLHHLPLKAKELTVS